ncbi:MAG: 4-aminobutyrate--2-oxoglutarate transaminase [Armatimonadota bacterium]|nr:4-aminobutyrate--2-oxoglutarate transaminase [Armatimonadota bacterium]MDR5703670.1 4-aminobutyrate--2-oxoglutarate transaminase [Armatimonadota bacterium]MDR7435224.1 4-aminobutyrate--2-oxoglutarate transaminase [Armatimonadota bacterium]
MRQATQRYSLPGPRSRQLLEEKVRYVPRAIPVHLPAVIERAEGAILVDVDGNRFIDLAGGIGCMNVGHSHPKVVQAVIDQVQRFTHTDFSIAPYAPYIELAKRLSTLAPGSTPKQAVFFNSGAEAVENAVKIARAYTRRPAVLVFEGAFHGRTYMAMTMTSKVVPYKLHFGPFVPEVYRLPYPYPYRCPLGSDRCTEYALDALERAFVTMVHPEQVAAVVIEPVLGEGGFVVPPKDFLPALREICDEHGILLVVDEVQTGFGRTGKFFAIEHFQVEPDLITVAKSIAAGLPLSGVIGKRRILQEIPENSIGGTFVGNPVSCAAALAVLDVIEEEHLLQRAEVIGRRMRERFEAMAERVSLIGEVRGLGAMVGIELVKDRSTKAPATQETRQILQQAMERGVLVVKAGIYDNVIRVLSPLVITETQLDEALDVLEEAIASVAS